MKFAAILAALLVVGEASALTVRKDKYSSVDEYDDESKQETKQGSFRSMNDMNGFAAHELRESKTPLDDKTLFRQIDVKGLHNELNSRSNGAGIKDKGDLNDLVNSIKGARTFLNKTPKNQL